jgi:hypothetical protein
MSKHSEQARGDLGIVTSRANTGHFRFWANRTSSRHHRNDRF